jgi:hypothetical protein
MCLTLLRGPLSNPIFICNDLVLYALVRNTDRSDFSFFFGLQQGFVRFQATFGTGERVVDEKQVDVVWGFK